MAPYGRAGKSRARVRAGQGRAGQGRAGQGRAGPLCTRSLGTVSQVHQFIAEFWDTKREYDAIMGYRSLVEDFMSKHVMDCYGRPEEAVIMSYNLLHACHSMSKDPTARLFLYILLNRLPEDAHYEEAHVLDALRLELERAEESGSAQESPRSAELAFPTQKRGGRRHVSKGTVLKCLEQVLVHWPRHRLLRLAVALHVAYTGPEIDRDRLLTRTGSATGRGTESDTTSLALEPTLFTQTLRMLMIDNQLEYMADVHQALHEAADADGTLPARVFQPILLDLDPLKSLAEVEQQVNTCCRKTLDPATPLEPSMPIKVDAFCMAYRALYPQRCTPKDRVHAVRRAQRIPLLSAEEAGALPLFAREFRLGPGAQVLRGSEDKELYRRRHKTNVLSSPSQCSMSSATSFLQI